MGHLTEQIDKLRQLNARRTPGPYLVDHLVDPESEGYYLTAGEPVEGTCIASYESLNARLDETTDPEAVAADFNYLALAANLAPALADEVERLRKAILSFGNGTDFDWAVLQKIDELEVELAERKQAFDRLDQLREELADRSDSLKEVRDRELDNG